MIFLDTSFCVALVVKSDSLHRRALAYAAVLREPFLTTDFVVIEIVNFLSHLSDRERARQAVDWLTTSPKIEILPAERTAIEAGLQFHAARPDKEWSLTDCISFQVMQELNLTQALTYDHHFEQAGFEALLRKDPPAA